MNCSGKHAAMLASLRGGGLADRQLPDPAHPLQRAIRRTLDGWPVSRSTAAGVDGCGAPLFALSLTGLARALRALVSAPARARRSAGWPTPCGPTRSGRRGAAARSGR